MNLLSQKCNIPSSNVDSLKKIGHVLQCCSQDLNESFNLVEEKDMLKTCSPSGIEDNDPLQYFYNAHNIKVETVDMEEDAIKVPMDEERTPWPRISHKVKEELDLDIIKEEIEDSTIHSIGFEEEPQTWINMEFAFPRMKKEDNVLQLLSENSSFEKMDCDLQESLDARLTTSVKEKAMLLYNTLMDFTTDDGRRLIIPFLENPLHEFQPQYYEVISEPMDMKAILLKINGDSYLGLKDVERDLVVMLKNAQKYHEKNSQVFIDAEILSNVLNEKLNEINKRTAHNVTGKLLKEMKQLYNSVRFYRDKNLKILSSPFIKLPSMKHIPDYLQVVKEPIELDHILSKINMGLYISLKNVFDDLNLLFNNACRYYEPQSIIYRNALLLQNVAIKKFLEIQGVKENFIDVKYFIQCKMVMLFNQVLNIRSNKGKYLSSSFSKLPVYEEVGGKRCCMMSFDVMKYRLDQGFYTRLDIFQNDLFIIFEKARQYSNIDSRLYSDTVIMQRKYIAFRDETFRHESLTCLKSRALDFREEDLLKHLEKEKQEKLQQLRRNRSAINKTIKDTIVNVTNPLQENVLCKVGEFVYLPPPNNSAGYNRICQIISISMTSLGNRFIHGYHYLRAEETHYKPWQKFYENEVFRTEKRINILESEVLGKCLVLTENNYKNYSTEDFNEKDVYVCMTRYNTLLKRYSIVKNWYCNLPPDVRLLNRDKPLEMKSQCLSSPMSLEKRKILFTELESSPTNYITKQNILKPLDKTIDGHLFYVQYSTQFGVIKLGDFVYLDGSGQRSIIHINRIYVTKDNRKFVIGLRYVLASDIPISIKGLQLEHKKEVYFTATQETHSIEDIVGRCSVLTIKEYVKKRLIEISEKDVYLCKYHFDEQMQTILPLQSEIIKYNLPSNVQQDEIYFFLKPLDSDRIEKSSNWFPNVENKKGKFSKSKAVAVVENSSCHSIAPLEKVVCKRIAINEKNIKSQLTLVRNPYKSKPRIGKTPKNKSKRKLLPETIVWRKRMRSRIKINENLRKKRKTFKNIKVDKMQIPSSQASRDPKSKKKHSLVDKIQIPSSQASRDSKSKKNLILKTTKSVFGRLPDKKSICLKGSKNPVRAFIHFVIETRDELTYKNPFANFNEISQMLATNWVNLPKSTKVKYRKKAQTIPAMKFDEIKNDQIKGYTLFCSEMRKICRTKYPNAKIGLVTHILKNEWIYLSDKEKNYYQTTASLWALENEEIEPDFIGFPEVMKCEPLTAKVKATTLDLGCSYEYNSLSPLQNNEYYSSFKLKKCKVLVNPLTVPLNSQKSFMINDINGGFVFLVRPSDHIKYNANLNYIKREGHKEILTQLKPFLCDKCGKSYRKKVSLRSHIRKHENGSLFRCKICKPRKNFGDHSDFISHMDLTHGPNWNIFDQDYRYPASYRPGPYCRSRAFTNINSLNLNSTSSEFINSDSFSYGIPIPSSPLLSATSSVSSDIDPQDLISTFAGASFSVSSSTDATVPAVNPIFENSPFDEHIISEGHLNLTSASPTSTVSSCFSSKASNCADQSFCYSASMNSFDSSCMKYKGNKSYNLKQNSDEVRLVSIRDALSYVDSDPHDSNELNIDVAADETSSPFSNYIESSENTITIHSTSTGGIIIDGMELNSHPIVDGKNITVDIGPLECSFPMSFESSIDCEEANTITQKLSNEQCTFDNAKISPLHLNTDKINYIEDFSIGKEAAICLPSTDSSMILPSQEADFSGGFYLESSNNGSIPENFNSEDFIMVESSVDKTSNDLLLPATTEINCLTKLENSNLSGIGNPINLQNVGVCDSDVELSKEKGSAFNEDRNSFTQVEKFVFGKDDSISEPSESVVDDFSFKFLLSCPTVVSSDVLPETIDDLNQLDLNLIESTSLILHDTASSLTSVSVKGLHSNNDKYFCLSSSNLTTPSSSSTAANHPSIKQRNKLGKVSKKEERKPYHQNSGNQPRFPCSKCSQLFYKKSDYNKHFFEHSGSATKSFKCHKCNDVFTTVFSKETYLIWNKKKSKPLCANCQIHPVSSELPSLKT